MGKTLFFGTTRHDVMVVHHVSSSPDAEWETLMKECEARGSQLTGVLVHVVGDTGPTPRQRIRLKEATKVVSKTLPIVMLADSAIARGILTALNWITGRSATSHAFHTRDLAKGLRALNLSPVATLEAQELLSKLQAEAVAHADS